MKTITTTEGIELFKTALVGNNYSPKTVRAYIDDLRQFTGWLATGSVSADDPKTISKLDINKFLGHLASNKATGKTRYRKIGFDHRVGHLWRFSIMLQSVHASFCPY